MCCSDMLTVVPVRGWRMWVENGCGPLKASVGNMGACFSHEIMILIKAVPWVDDNSTKAINLDLAFHFDSSKTKQKKNLCM